MNKTNIKGCRRMLEVKRAELLSSHHETEGIAAQRVPDSMEELSLELQRNMAVEALNRKAALLCQVTEALERIAGGKYGVCLACNEAISPRRLSALPWAALCIECQQAVENRLGTDAKTSMGLRLGYSVSNSGEQLANSSSGHDHRLRRPVIPRASRNGGASKSEARL
jgi:DnaK suppressor protein